MLKNLQLIQVVFMNNLWGMHKNIKPVKSIKTIKNIKSIKVFMGHYGS